MITAEVRRARWPLSLRERFETKYTPEPNTGCWLWFGTVKVDGYGRIKCGSPTRACYAHRVSWELHRGPIPAGMVLDHICRVPGCVNPDHLRVVTPRENILATGSLAQAAQHARKTACPRCGGAYSFNSNGSRGCKACQSRRVRQ